jgi:predicted lipoprotein
MKQRYKYIPIVLILAVLLSRSCYFERLDEAKEEAAKKSFDPAEYARDFWDNKLMKNLDRAVDAQTLLELLNTNIKQAKNKYGRTLGLSSVCCFLLSGQGEVVSMNEDGVFISIRTPQSDPDIIVATSFILGNAIRDASGFVDADQFPNSRDFNNISEEINKIVTTHVISPFLEKVEKGIKVKFVGAAEISEDEPKIRPLQVIPILLETEDST